jgi:hypothetical protein
MGHLLFGFRQAQIPVLALLLLTASAAKFARAARAGAADAGLGAAVLFPQPLRRRVVIMIGAVEFTAGVALVVTATGTGHGALATTARLVTSLLFIIATLALVELRTTRPGAGCGCFGDLSTTPVGARTLVRSALLAGAGLSTLDLPPLQAPPSGTDAFLVLVGIAVELGVIATLSPELGEALVRLGYAEPCELRRLPASRTLSALYKSAQWRRHFGALVTNEPVDMWRELCWRYVVFTAHAEGREAEAVFAVYLRPHRPTVHAALVDAATGALLDWPAAAHWRGRPARAAKPAWLRPWASGSRPAAGRPAAAPRVPARGRPAPGEMIPVHVAVPLLSAPTHAAAPARLAAPALGSTGQPPAPALASPGQPANRALPAPGLAQAAQAGNSAPHSSSF